MLIKLVENINKILGKNIEPMFEKKRIGDVKHSLAGIEKAKKMLGKILSIVKLYVVHLNNIHSQLLQLLLELFRKNIYLNT